MMKKTILINLLLILTALSAFAGDFELYQKAGHRSPKWDSLVKAGFSSYDGGDLNTGLVFMQKAYNLGCRDGLLLFKMGIYYESQKNYKEAEKFLRQASDKLSSGYPDYSETKKLHEHLARLYYQSDQFDKALPEIEEALKTSPDNFMMLFISAQIYRSQKKYPEAITNFEKALQVGTDYKKIVYTELMALYYELKDFPSSLKYAEMVLAISPGDPAALSYQREIKTMQYKEKEREAIKKLFQ